MQPGHEAEDQLDQQQKTIQTLNPAGHSAGTLHKRQCPSLGGETPKWKTVPSSHCSTPCTNARGHSCAEVIKTGNRWSSAQQFQTNTMHSKVRKTQRTSAAAWNGEAPLLKGTSAWQASFDLHFCSVLQQITEVWIKSSHRWTWWIDAAHPQDPQEPSCNPPPAAVVVGWCISGNNLFDPSRNILHTHMHA
jgi:hypothetical protein